MKLFDTLRKLTSFILNYGAIFILIFIILHYIFIIKPIKESFIYNGKTKITDNDILNMNVQPINKKNRLSDLTLLKLKEKLDTNGNSKVINLHNNIQNYITEKEGKYYLKNNKFEYNENVIKKIEKIMNEEILVYVKKTMALNWLKEKKEKRLEKLKRTNLKKYNEEISKNILKNSKYTYDTITLKMYEKTIRESNEKIAKKNGRENDEEYIKKNIEDQKKAIDDFVKNITNNLITLMQQIPIRLLLVNQYSSVFLSIFGEEQYTHNFLKRILNIKNIQPLFINNSIIKCETDSNTGNSALMSYTIDPSFLLENKPINLENGYIRKKKIHDDEVPSVMSKIPIEFKYLKEPCNICDLKSAHKCPYSINGKVSQTMSEFWGVKGNTLNKNNVILPERKNKNLDMADTSLIKDILEDDIDSDVIVSELIN